MECYIFSDMAVSAGLGFYAIIALTSYFATSTTVTQAYSEGGCHTVPCFGISFLSALPGSCHARDQDSRNLLWFDDGIHKYGRQWAILFIRSYPHNRRLCQRSRRCPIQRPIQCLLSCYRMISLICYYSSRTAPSSQWVLTMLPALITYELSSIFKASTDCIWCVYALNKS